MKVEESRKKVEFKSTFSRIEKMKVEVDKSTRTFECSTFFRSVHATVSTDSYRRLLNGRNFRPKTQ
jgi:hypothetical protein